MPHSIPTKKARQAYNNQLLQGERTQVKPWQSQVAHKNPYKGQFQGILVG